MRIAVLLKQVPVTDEPRLGPDRRLVRVGSLEMDPFGRRAATVGIRLAAEHGGTCTAITMGPPSAVDVLAEAVAAGATDAVLVSDPRLSGADTLVTARALTAALRRFGPFDLVLTGAASTDSETGQVPAELAALAHLGLVARARTLEIVDGRQVVASCEHDIGLVEITAALPAVVSAAERLADPCRAPAEARPEPSPTWLATLDLAALGPSAWTGDASPTSVGHVQSVEPDRRRLVLAEGAMAERVASAVDVLEELEALPPWTDAEPGARGEAREPSTDGAGRVIVALFDPDAPAAARAVAERAGARFSSGRESLVAVVASKDTALEPLSGVREVLVPTQATDAAGLAEALARWARHHHPFAIVSPSTEWCREVLGRLAALLGAGLVGDAVDLEVDDLGPLAWKPALEGTSLVEVRWHHEPYLATLRGLTPRFSPGHLDHGSWPSLTPLPVDSAPLVTRTVRERLDTPDELASAPALVVVGTGVDPSRYGDFEPLCALLGATMGCSRKVADRGWMPRSRQVGLTGTISAPRLVVSVGASGKHNHVVGFKAAGAVLALNTDPGAEVFRSADVGIVGAWEEVLGTLVDELGRRLGQRNDASGGRRSPAG